MEKVSKAIALSVLGVVWGLAAGSPTVAAQDTGKKPAQNTWWQSGREAVMARAASKPNTHRAKNVILFVADGMGISTITAARIFDGQSQGGSGEENSLSFETFPHLALVKTYNTDAQVPDSAGTASALNTGVKTRIGVINIWPEQSRDDCYGPVTAFPHSLAERAEQRGMVTGVVSTARITHATPAAVYGHAPSREWESDADIPAADRKRGCKDLAQQLVHFPFGDGLDLVFGGGKRAFLTQGQGGRRLDGRNLLSEWRSRYPQGVLIENAKQLRSHKPGTAKKVLGLFSDSHMAYEADRDNRKEASLAEMTTFAIDHLSATQQGYFLMVEGGRVDHAHHDTNAYRALSDTQAFARAVQAAVNKVDLTDTLILVTADHSHVFTIAGYPKRGNPILGLVYPPSAKGSGNSDQRAALAQDGRPYTTLGYHNGVNPRSAAKAALTDKHTMQPDFRQQTAIPLESETHGGEDVALFATGASSYLVGGVIEQNVVFHIIARSLGWDLYE